MEVLLNIMGVVRYVFIVAPCWRDVPATSSYAQAVPHTDVAQTQPHLATSCCHHLDACDIHSHGIPQSEEVGIEAFFEHYGGREIRARTHIRKRVFETTKVHIY